MSHNSCLFRDERWEFKVSPGCWHSHWEHKHHQWNSTPRKGEWHCIDSHTPDIHNFIVCCMNLVCVIARRCFDYNIMTCVLMLYTAEHCGFGRLWKGVQNRSNSGTTQGKIFNSLLCFSLSLPLFRSRSLFPSLSPLHTHLQTHIIMKYHTQ